MQAGASNITRGLQLFQSGAELCQSCFLCWCPHVGPGDGVFLAVSLLLSSPEPILWASSAPVGSLAWTLATPTPYLAGHLGLWQREEWAVDSRQPSGRCPPRPKTKPQEQKEGCRLPQTPFPPCCWQSDMSRPFCLL